MTEKYRDYPGFSQTKVTDSVGIILEELHLKGYSIAKEVISRARAADLAYRLDMIYEQQLAEYGEARLRQLKEFEVVRDLLLRDPIFSELVIEPRVLEVVDAVIGKTAILNLQNGSVAFPTSAHHQHAYHRDFAKDFVCSKLLSLNAFFCVTDFTTETGATWVVPNSHKTDWLPSDHFIKENGIQMIAPAGSVIFWDSLLLHKAGYNQTQKNRHGINHMFTRPFIKQQLDFPVLLKGKYEIESRLGQLLGF